MESLFHHFALPQRLPGSEEDNLDEIEGAFVNRLDRAAWTMRTTSGQESDTLGLKITAAWQSIRRLLFAAKTVNPGGIVNGAKLQAELGSMAVDGALLVYVGSQNAALFIYRLSSSSDRVIFEVFEASPRNEDILAADALQWDFPGHAVEIPHSTFSSRDFRASLATFLEQASIGLTKPFAGQTSKAGMDIHEYRDTANPTMISSMLMAVLEESGRRIPTQKLRKRVRDDVCWQARKPWRRSPYWLALRVSISRYLLLTLGEELGRFEYKFLLCTCLASLLRDTQNSLDVHEVNFLKAKLCRRFAKLDAARNKLETSDAGIRRRVDHLNELSLSSAAGTVDQVGQSVRRRWEEFKANTTRYIPLLQKQASPQDIHLPLSVSRDTLERVRVATNRAIMTSRRKWTAPRDFDLSRQADEQFNNLAGPFLGVAAQESGIRKLGQTPGASPSELSKRLHRYVETALPLYREDADQMSILILESMQIWKRLDEEMLDRCPIFADYPPIFTPEVLDVLHLASYQDMARLQSLQSYLRSRIESCRRNKHVFADPSEDCYGRRYYDESEDGELMRALRQEIETDADGRKQSKFDEWQQQTARHEALARQISESTCLFTTDIFTGRDVHAEGRCQRCDAMWQLDHLRIKIYEHPLPSDDFMAKVVVFELACPVLFSIYRDATWMLVARLGSSGASSTNPPRCMLGEYSELSEYGQGQNPAFTLASSTKSFLRTHYATLTFPVGWENGRDGVCNPNGLRLAYFDTGSKTWARGAHVKPGFSHHFGLRLPRGFPAQSVLSAKPKRSATQDEGPSSYEAMATQINCPSGLSPHEFLAFKTLMSGFARRWITILVELGSTNINWSSEATTMLIHHLALQCGPASEQQDPLRLAHSIFNDVNFVEKLLKQVDMRLESLETMVSWRETNVMDTMITLALRVLSLTELSDRQTGMRHRALSSVLRARRICVRWFRQLREEIQTTSDIPKSRNLQQYALAAALLCRRTFVIHLENCHSFDAVSLEEYVESTIALQENIISNAARALSPTMMRHLVFSIKLSSDLRSLVISKIAEHQDGLQNGLRHFWPEADRMKPGSMDIQFQSPGWVRFDLPENDVESHQVVWLDLLLGCLLVNGKTVGKLPQDSQNSVAIKELFQDQPLRAYQSGVPGMSYALVNEKNGFKIHVGYEGDETIILAKSAWETLRFLPRETFSDKKKDTHDLPGPLTTGCIHWLNLRTGDVYITPVANPWLMSGSSTWTINRRKGTCERIRADRLREAALNPHSAVFQHVAAIMEGLAPRGQLLISQPFGNKNLEVQIGSLQLMFFVNHNQLLWSPQLGLEVDPNQDAGTWYGLNQKLVCRHVSNPFRRMVLVPLGGDITTKRQGCHVAVQIGKSDRYGKFTINDTIGRVDCAAEPQLLYTKALLHAYTSFFIPDPLTGRTGAEESLHWLQSGACSPWTVLGSEASILSAIGNLTPIREYYPPGRKVMKVDKWDKHLTSHIQHPLYRQVVEGILNMSRELETFSPTQVSNSHGRVDAKLLGDGELNLREWKRRQRYERPTPDHHCGRSSKSEIADTPYMTRDTSSSAERPYAKIMETACLLRAMPTQFNTPANIVVEFGKGNLIGGYASGYTKVSISDQMSTDIMENWGALVKHCRENQSVYSRVFLFAALCFRENTEDALLKALVAFTILPALQAIELPPWPSYSLFRPGRIPQLDDIARLMAPFRKPYQTGSADELGSLLPAKQRRKAQKDKEAYELKSEQDCHLLAKFLLAQWPCLEPSLTNFPDTTLQVDTSRALESILPEWSRLFQNHEFGVHIQRVQRILDQHRSELKYIPPTAVSLDGEFSVCNNHTGHHGVPRLEYDLLTKSLDTGCAPPANNHSVQGWIPLASIPQDGRKVTAGRANNFRPTARPPQISAIETGRYIAELRQITEDLRQNKSLVRQRYASDLLNSLESLERLKKPKKPANSFLWQRALSASQEETVRAFRVIKTALEAQSLMMSPDHVWWLQQGGLWPAVTTVTLLEQLRSTSGMQFGPGMRDAVIAFGLAITRLQRDIRLNDCYLVDDVTRFQDEEANTGHTNWDPSKETDWMLLEIESNLLIRHNQVEVARATISPSSGSNSVLQMNMGQGKTSCIMPMAAASLADGKSLVRVIVPKALLLQTAQLLQSRLGGMLNRRICHVPFSRRTMTTEGNVRSYFSVNNRLMKATGVMLCLPEHSLSFMLSGQQRVLDNKLAEAKPMIRVQSWLRSVCRDILDESDYTLAACTQLIYPSGSQVSVDGHPHRWQVIESILGLVDQHLYGLEASYPYSIEVVRRSGGGFPFIYFLRRDAEDELLIRLVADVTAGVNEILPMRSFGAKERIAIKDFLAPGFRKLRPGTLKIISDLRPDRPHIKQTAYLLRGLLVNRILIMTLKKRWNVQYGLRPMNDPVAVPFLAKGVPSEQSEWGHPDVAILFTCLTFYYDGVSEDQLRQALVRVKKSDDPATEYDKWVCHTEHFPASLCTWNTINVEDASQVRDIWRAVRYQVVVVDYFLNNFVFPQHAKQFKVKLQSSGWDIPQFSAHLGEVEEQALRQGARPLTTGFSGTNDNRTMLPLTIQQADLPSLSHTNAEVLTYLLHTRSRKCKVITDVNGKRATERDLLFMLRTMGIAVLIDAGALVLEMDNETLAKTWLNIADRKYEAAMYFDAANKAMVISRMGKCTPLLASPYADDLGNCLVYLDEAHTRGTDLKFPLNARGGLTVGQGQSKDHTVQAAMRLRQLGTSQSITFLIPPEVHQVILDLMGKTAQDTIDSHDVILWMLDNSCDGIEQLQPLYYSQGIDFCRRTQAAIDNPDFIANSDHKAKYVGSIKLNELQTLQDMYEPKEKVTRVGDFKSSHPKVAAFAKELNIRRKGFQDTGRAVHGSALQEVEQEREVAFEIEVERQPKKPRHYEAMGFPGLARDIASLARSGRLPIDSHSMTHYFRFLAATSLGRKHKIVLHGSHMDTKLFVSCEFQRTVKLYTDLSHDNFLRPVSWILWSELVEVAVVVIPEEAEMILRMMRAHETHPDIHLITYASPVTRKMREFNRLEFFSTPQLPRNWKAPQWLKIGLGLLAGRLHFEWEEYEALCEAFAVHENSIPMMDGAEDNDEPDVEDQGENAETRMAKGFSTRPLLFLQEWLALRRQGQDFSHTPMGFLTQDKPLHAEHPLFSEAKAVPLLGGANGSLAGPGLGNGINGDEAGGGNGMDFFDGVDDMGANVGDEYVDAGHESDESSALSL